MRCLILGCGEVGVAVGRHLVDDGWSVAGVRRHPDGLDHGFPIHAGDGSDPLFLRLMEPPEVVLMVANPGIRRGRDNRLVDMARAVSQIFPRVRLIYTGTTAVYGDAGGAAVDESGGLDDSRHAQALLDIEHQVLAHPAASLVLRVTALVGPTRVHARERVAAAIMADGIIRIPGPVDRPFSHLHDRDLASVLRCAVHGGLGSGMLNAAAPCVGTVADYYRSHAGQLGAVITVEPDTEAPLAPSRSIDARRLWSMMPGQKWLGFRTGS